MDAAPDALLPMLPRRPLARWWYALIVAEIGVWAYALFIRGTPAAQVVGLVAAFLDVGLYFVLQWKAWKARQRPSLCQNQVTPRRKDFASAIEWRLWHGRCG